MSNIILIQSLIIIREYSNEIWLRRKLVAIFHKNNKSTITHARYRKSIINGKTNYTVPSRHGVRVTLSIFVALYRNCMIIIRVHKSLSFRALLIYAKSLLFISLDSVILLNEFSIMLFCTIFVTNTTQYVRQIRMPLWMYIRHNDAEPFP